MKTNKSLTRIRNRQNTVMILKIKVIKFENFLNFDVNLLLKPKKERRSNITTYLLNSVIK